MYKSINEQEMVGRTIKSVNTIPTLEFIVIVFTDETYSVATAAVDYDNSTEISFDFCEAAIFVKEYPEYALEYGIITEEEKFKFMREEKEKYESNERDYELRLLEELKEKYESLK